MSDEDQPLAARYEALERAVAERTQFLAIAQHKLKTPLAVLSGWASTLTQWELLEPDERAEGIEAIERATEEIRQQIDDLLDEARIHLLGDSLRVEPVALAPFLDAAVARLRLDPDRHPASVEVDPGCQVLADLDGLHQVVSHLLDNAVKYSPTGGPITVRAAAGDPVRIEILDRGIGLEEEVDVFAPFERARNASLVARGTGLGLHIVRMLVHGMGGQVRARPRPGRGTVVSVELPAAPDGVS